jgi:hypothetical protein
MTKRPSLASNMKALAEPTAPDPVALVAKAREERSPAPVSVPAPAERRSFHAATREGMKRLLTPVEPSLHKRLKMLAVQQETTLEAITRAALAEYVEKHE